MDGAARNQDAAGNTTSIGSKTFAYNDANRMSAVKQDAAVVESYGYNHRGERVLRAPASGDAQITVYDEAGQWVGNYSTTGQAQQQAIWLDNYPVALIQTPASGVPELAYIQPDHLGTPRVVIDPLRDVAIWEWSNKSEVFGDQVPANDPDGDGVVFDLALRFPGQQATNASGLFYNYQREYEPAVGRYSQTDPIGLDGGISTFTYVSSNPLGANDPLGLFNAADLPNLPDWLVDGAAGLGDGISGGLTSDFRDWANIGSVDKCSTIYQAAEWTGIAAGLAVPVGRVSYVYKVGQLPKAGLSLEQTVAARNALKSYYRGRPMDTLLPAVSGRFGYPGAQEILVKNGGDAARAIARSGNTSLPWTAGLVGGGAAKAANSTANAAGRDCGCN